MSKMSDARKYLTKKARIRSSGYPIATIAYYGPTDQFASKVAVGILDRKENMLAMERWFATNEDVRLDETICQEIVVFIKQHEAYRVAMVDGIIGCPHEEGIDYPQGESCPECSFWEGRARWTGELLH